MAPSPNGHGLCISLLVYYMPAQVPAERRHWIAITGSACPFALAMSLCHLCRRHRADLLGILQGPLQNTVEHMWQMAWEQGCTTIVMLTRCVEDRASKACACCHTL